MPFATASVDDPRRSGLRRCSVIVRISDDGKGIRTELLSERRGADHWGIAGMYERSANLGADLKICRCKPEALRLSCQCRRPLLTSVLPKFRGELLTA